MPSPVDKYFKSVKEKNPSYTDEQAWATAWSIYCKHKNPGSEHCHKPAGEYLKGKSAALREFQDAIIIRNVVARVMQEYTAKAEAKKAEKRYAENKKLLGEMETLRRKVENADESAAKKFDRAYGKLFENGMAASKAGEKLLREYGGEDASDWLSRCVRQWNGNVISHRETDGDNVPVNVKMRQLPNTYAYAQQLDAVIKDFDKVLKDPGTKLDESWRH